MSPCPEPAWFRDDSPRIAQYCAVCRKVTPHDLSLSEGRALATCVTCLTRAIRRESDKE